MGRWEVGGGRWIAVGGWVGGKETGCKGREGRRGWLKHAEVCGRPRVSKAGGQGAVSLRNPTPGLSASSKHSLPSPGSNTAAGTTAGGADGTGKLLSYLFSTALHPMLLFFFLAFFFFFLIDHDLEFGRN